MKIDLNNVHLNHNNANIITENQLNIDKQK